MAACVLYAAIVLTITAIWVYVGRSWSFSFLAQAMFFPSVLSLFFVDNYFSFITTALGVKEVRHIFFYLIYSTFVVYLFMLLVIQSELVFQCLHTMVLIKLRYNMYYACQSNIISFSTFIVVNTLKQRLY